jgi:hypothetical protein
LFGSRGYTKRQGTGKIMEKTPPNGDIQIMAYPEAISVTKIAV